MAESASCSGSSLGSAPSDGADPGAGSSASPSAARQVWAELEDAQGRRAGGAGGGQGISAEELQEMQKVDPKRAKRILANRSSAARSKVRKLRYIAELEGKSAALQEEASRLHEELHKLQADAVVLSQQNEELFKQAFQVQDHMQGQGLETERLIQQVARLQALQSAAAPALTTMLTAASVPAAFEPAWHPSPVQHLQAQLANQLPPLDFVPQRQPVAPLPMHPFAAAVHRMQGHANTAIPSAPPPLDARAGQLRRSFPRAFVRSPFASEEHAPGFGAPLPPPALPRQAAAVDPKLLELLSLEPRQGQLARPPLHTRMPQRVSADSAGLLGALSPVESAASTALPSLMSGSSLQDEGRGRSLSSLSTATSGAFAVAAFEPPATGPPAGPWRRHLSDPLSLQRSSFG